MRTDRAIQLKIYYFFILWLVVAAVSDVSASSEVDAFIKGYATALLQQEYSITPATLKVDNGVIILSAEDIQGADHSEVIRSLLSINGVVSVEILESGNKDVMTTSAFHMRTRLFEPLIADTRWPHFSMSYQHYIDDEELKSVGATSFGETIPLYKSHVPFGGEWQVGIQAAVYAVFDLDAESHDLINADYWVGIPVSYRERDFSGLLRIFHQSSHIGDEYILRSRIDRVNLSYEGIDMKLSYDVMKWFRIYTGSGFLFRTEPEDIKPWSMQYGFELKSPRSYLSNVIKPVAGADFKSRQEDNWNTDVSLRGGIELEIKWIDSVSSRLQIMLEYLHGNSPNGQFYELSIEYIGLGTHFYFY